MVELGGVDYIGGGGGGLVVGLFRVLVLEGVRLRDDDSSDKGPDATASHPNRAPAFDSP